MLRSTSFFLITAMFLASLPRCASAQLLPENDFSDEEREYLRSFRAQHREVVGLFSNMSVKVAVKGFMGPETKPLEKLDNSYFFYANGPQLKRLDTELFRKKKGEISGDLAVKEVVMTNEYGYVVARSEGSKGAMVLIDMAADAEAGLRQIEMFGIPACAYCIFGVPLEIWLFDVPGNYEDYRLVDFERRTETSRETVRLRAEYIVGKEQAFWQVVLDEDSGVVLEYEVGGKKVNANGQAKHGRIDYDFSAPTPKIELYTTWVSTIPEQSIYNKETHRVVEYDATPADKSLFYPASIGLDIDYGSKKGWWLYALIALALLGVAFLLRAGKR